MSAPQIVIDANVFISALRSRLGASYKLLSLIDSGKFEINLSVPLVIEYEDAGKRLVGRKSNLKASDIDDILITSAQWLIGEQSIICGDLF